MRICIVKVTNEIQLLILALIGVALRLFGNASVVILTGIDPRPVAVGNRLLAWVISFGAALLAMF